MNFYMTSESMMTQYGRYALQVTLNGEHVIPILFGSMAALLTIVLYMLIRTSWPGLYFGPDDRFGTIISSSAVSYACFRTLPILAMVGFAGTYSSRASEDSVWALVISYITVYTIASILLKASGRRQYGRSLSHADKAWLTASTALVIIGAISGSLLVPVFDKILPSGESISEAVITAIFVAAIALAGRALSFNNARMDVVVTKALRREAAILSEIEHQCADLNIPSEPIIAIYIAEALQRPRWFRRLERIAAKFGMAKTLGPLQATMAGKSKPDGAFDIDIESFLRAKPALGVILTQPASPSQQSGHDSLEAIYAIHNPSANFVKFCRFIRQHMEPGYSSNFVKLPKLGCTLNTSDILISGETASINLAPVAEAHPGVIAIRIIGTRHGVAWHESDRTMKRLTAPLEEFFLEWQISIPASPEPNEPSVDIESESSQVNTSGSRTAVESQAFYIQDHVNTSPRWG